MTLAAAWLLVAIAFAFLWAWWRLLIFTLELVEQGVVDGRRRVQAGAEDPAKPKKAREASGSQ